MLSCLSLILLMVLSTSTFTDIFLETLRHPTGEPQHTIQNKMYNRLLGLHRYCLYCSWLSQIKDHVILSSKRCYCRGQMASRNVQALCSMPRKQKLNKPLPNLTNRYAHLSHVHCNLAAQFPFMPFPRYCTAHRRQAVKKYHIHLDCEAFQHRVSCCFMCKKGVFTHADACRIWTATW